MILTAHRINKIKDLSKIKYNFGVEVDIRDCGKELILSHDPFKKGESFIDFVQHFKHKFLICNVKSERIEERVFGILKKKK